MRASGISVNLVNCGSRRKPTNQFFHRNQLRLTSDIVGKLIVDCGSKLSHIGRN